MPVATLYQYFADKEAVLLALAQRDMDEMDAEVAAALVDARGAGPLTVASVVRATMEAFVRVYHRRRAFVEIYLRGRTNLAVHRFGREHNERVASVAAGLRRRRRAGRRRSSPPSAPGSPSRSATGSSSSPSSTTTRATPTLVEEGIVLVTAYLERYAA